jgi:CDP-glucose 4,6-dehydratase
MEDLVIDSTFWTGRRVFLTGHTGFKGSWLALWLSNMGAQVHGYALAPLKPGVFESARLDEVIAGHTVGDLRDTARLSECLQEVQPEVVFHLAAQPLVRYSYREPVETYMVNVMGTVHLLEAVRTCESVRVVVNITTDKCYENREWVWGYRECEPMGGRDPYSSSKACAELVTAAYRDSFFEKRGLSVATARAGNVIGGGDWGTDRLLPDFFRANRNGQELGVRYPEATRPWQHVLEPLCGYLILAQHLHASSGEFSEGWNFGR